MRVRILGSGRAERRVIGREGGGKGESENKEKGRYMTGWLVTVLVTVVGAERTISVCGTCQ